MSRQVPVSRWTVIVGTAGTPTVRAAGVDLAAPRQERPAATATATEASAGSSTRATAVAVARPASWRRPALAGLVLLALLLALAACGGPAAVPTPSPPPPATPRSGRVPPPTPDPAAVAAGAPLRATLLAQLDEYEREVCAATPGPATPVARTRACMVTADPRRHRELVAYAGWFGRVESCYYDEQAPGGYRIVPTLAPVLATPAQLREPWRLDLYVAGADWCGVPAR